MPTSVRSDAKKSYRRRIKLSQCRGVLGRTVCNKTPGCRMSRGEKRSFCRKRRNTRRKR